MPSRYSSDHSKSDARVLAENLGIEFLTIAIEPIFVAYLEQLKQPFKGRPADVAEENLQSRIRGSLLMALSNKFGGLVLATGNKTELALGYATLYGDMSGGLEVIGDVSKTEVYALSRYYNQKAGRTVIPESCFSKIPSAELKTDQFDPFDYAMVSPLADDIIENRLSKAELLRKGYDERVVDDCLRRVRFAEYKRRQAPPVIKITKKAFGLGWKMPIVNKLPLDQGFRVFSGGGGTGSGNNSGSTGMTGSIGSNSRSSKLRCSKRWLDRCSNCRPDCSLDNSSRADNYRCTDSPGLSRRDSSE